MKKLPFHGQKWLKMAKKRSFLSRLVQNGYITGSQGPRKHNFHFIGTKNFDQALMILLKKLIFYSKRHLKMLKNGQKRSFLSLLEQNGYLMSNQRP